MRSNEHKRDATLKFYNQQLFCKPMERAWCISGHAQISVSNTFLFSFLIVLARSNFDHYARECDFGILKKKNKNKTTKTKHIKQNKRKIFRLCFN